MPLEWWPSGKPKPSIFTVPQEIADRILEYLYLRLAETSLTNAYAEDKFEDWRYHIAVNAFGHAESLKWLRPWYDFESVWSHYSNRVHITSVFRLLPQEIVDEIVERHHLAVLRGSLYTGGAYTKIKQWRNTVSQALGHVEAGRWLKDLSYYPILTAAFNKRGRHENMQYL